MAEPHDEWDVSHPGSDSGFSEPAAPQEPPPPRELRQHVSAERGTLFVGFIGLPNSGKTSYIHAIRNSAAISGRGHGRWDFGGALADSGDVFKDPDHNLQEATEAGYFEKAPFCRVKRAMLRLGSWSLGPTRTLVLPEVSGETLRAIAKGRKHASDLPNADKYLSFLAQSDRILCFVSMDGSRASVGGVVGLDPAKAIADQLPVISRVLEAADELRPRGSRYAVSVLLTKVDLLRDRQEFDQVAVPRDRSAVARLSRDPRYAELEQRLREQGSDDAQVRFSVWSLMRSPSASGDLDVQEALAADFLKCHAPKAAEHMAQIQTSGGRRRSARFFLTAPYGNTFTTSRGEQRKPDPSELQPVMLFEPLESALERCWLMHRGDRIRRRILSMVALLALVVLIGPGLTGALERWVGTALRDEAEATAASKAERLDQLEFRRNLLSWCPQMLLMHRSETVRGWYPSTATRVAKLYREVADRLEADATAQGDRGSARIIRAQAATLSPDQSDQQAQARQVWRWLEGQDAPPDKLYPETIRLVNAEFEPRVERWTPRDRTERLQKLEQEVRSAPPSDPTDELLRRIRRAQDREAHASLTDPQRLLATQSDGSPHGPALDQLRKLDRDRWQRARESSGTAVFKNPRDLKSWVESGSWDAVAQNRVARECLEKWVRAQAEGLRFAIVSLNRGDGAPVPSDALDRVGALVAGFLAESDPRLLPKWYPNWPIDLTEARERLAQIDAGFKLLGEIRADVSAVVAKQNPTLDLCILGSYPAGSIRVQRDELALGALWKALAAQVKNELISRVTFMAVSRPDMTRQLRARYPDDAEINRIEQLASIVGDLQRQIDEDGSLSKALDPMERILAESALKDQSLRTQVGGLLVEALLARADIVERVGGLGAQEAARLNDLLKKMGQADAFARRYFLKAFAVAREQARNRNPASVRQALAHCMDFGSVDPRASWRSSIAEYLGDVRRKYGQRRSVAELEAELQPDLLVLDQLGSIVGAQGASGDPTSLVKAMRTHLQRARDFDLVCVKGPGDGGPDFWLGRYELTRDRAVESGIAPRSLGSEPTRALWPLTCFAPSTTGTIKFVRSDELAALGLRLPTRIELEKVSERRKGQPQRVPDARRSEFRTPESLATVDKTDEGIVGLYLGVGEVCANGEVFERESNFKETYGVRLAMDLMPKELREPGAQN